MDGENTMVITQAVLVWTLLGFLLTWMITFAILAFRPDTTNNLEESNIAMTPSLSHSMVSTPGFLQRMVPQPLHSSVSSLNHDTSEDVNTAPVA